MIGAISEACAGSITSAVCSISPVASRRQVAWKTSQRPVDERSRARAVAVALARARISVPAATIGSGRLKLSWWSESGGSCSSQASASSLADSSSPVGANISRPGPRSPESATGTGRACSRTAPARGSDRLATSSISAASNASRPCSR